MYEWDVFFYRIYKFLFYKNFKICFLNVGLNIIVKFIEVYMNFVFNVIVFILNCVF